MTDVPLKEYLEGMLREQDRRIEQAHRSATKAVEKAEVAIGERLKLLNEFKDLAAAKDALYATKEMFLAMDRRMSDLEGSKDRIYGGIAIVALIGVVNLVKLFW